MNKYVPNLHRKKPMLHFLKLRIYSKILQTADDNLNLKILIKRKLI